MPHHEHEDDDEAFAEVVSDAEGRAARRSTIFHPDSILFRGSVVVVIIGAVWGIAISFTSFKDGQLNNRQDIDGLRAEIAKLRARVLLLREQDLWAEALRRENAGMVVPKPSEYKVEP